MLTSVFMNLLPLCLASGASEGAALGEPSDPTVALQRLCDAAWAPRPERFDMLVYRVRKFRQSSREEVRRWVEEMVEADYPPGASVTAAEHEELVEANTEHTLTWQKTPRRLFQRIGRDGERQRVDMVILKPEQEPSSASLRLSDWYVTLGKGSDSQGRNGIHVMGDARFARILPNDMHFAGTPIEEWLSAPFKTVMQVMLGEVEEPGKISLSQDRFEKVLSGEYGLNIRVTRLMDPRYSSHVLERVEIVDAENDRTRVAILCDHEDYERAYEVVIHDPATGNPIHVAKRRGYLPNNVATELETSTYDTSGTLLENDQLLVLLADFEPRFKAAYWELHAPSGYGVVDGRKAADEVLSAPEPESVRIGDAVRELLATARPESIVRENLSRVGIPIAGQSAPSPK